MLIILVLLSVAPLIYMDRFNRSSFFTSLRLNAGTLMHKLKSIKNDVPVIVNHVAEQATITVYQWKDSHGVTQFGDRPPRNAIDVKAVSVKQNKNIIDAVKVLPEPAVEEKSKTYRAHNPYSIHGMKKVIDDARNIDGLLKKHRQAQARAIKHL